MKRKNPVPGAKKTSPVIFLAFVFLILLCSCGNVVPTATDRENDTAVMAAVDGYWVVEEAAEDLGSGDGSFDDGMDSSLDVTGDGVPSNEVAASGESLVGDETPASDAIPMSGSSLATAADTAGASTCTLSVSCGAILANINSLNPEKAELVPDDGVIFYTQTAVFNEGESVFNLLQREMKRAKIHLEFVNTPVYDSSYIKGINNLYEFDCGELSGWTYKVNGKFPGYGPSRHRVQAGDVVEFVYSCDLGRDVGNEF